MRGALKPVHAFCCSGRQAERSRSWAVSGTLVCGEGSAGLGAGVLIRMFGITVIGHGGGHAGAIGAGGNGIIPAGGGAPRARIGPALHAVPSAVDLLLKLHFDRAVIGIRTGIGFSGESSEYSPMAKQNPGAMTVTMNRTDKRA